MGTMQQLETCRDEAWRGGEEVVAPGGSAAGPAWARRDHHRSIPRVAVPSLHELARNDLVVRRPWLAAMFTARVLLAAVVLVVSLQERWWVLVAPATWVFYGGAITAVHHMIHGSLGVHGRTRTWMLTVLTGLVLESGHALESTHLLHHDGDPASPDPEGYIEEVPWRRMPIEAVRFRYRLMWWGWHHADQRRRARVEIAWHVLAHLVAVAALPWTWVPVAVVVAIGAAAASFAVMAGKGPQTNYGRPVASPFVRVRTRVLRAFLFSHDRHLEHHLYPEVPLPSLRHLDEDVAPFLATLELVEVRLP